MCWLSAGLGHNSHVWDMLSKLNFSLSMGSKGATVNLWNWQLITWLDGLGSIVRSGSEPQSKLDFSAFQVSHSASVKKCVINLRTLTMYVNGTSRRYERISVQNRRFAPMGAGWPKIWVRRGRPTNHSSQKTRLNDLSYGIKIWTDLSSVLSQFTHLTDGWVDRIIIARPRLHSMQCGENRSSFV